MAKERIIKYFRGPSFTIDLWTSRNPYLKSGEIGYLIESGVVTRAKVGPGYWNDLDYFGEDVYGHSDIVTNEIGDTTGNLSAMKLRDILKLMLSPYQIPVISSVTNNAGGSFISTKTLEIGQSITSPLTVLYSLSSPENLSGATPVTVSAGGVFNNEGSFVHTGSIQLTLAAPYTPSSVNTVTITLSATHLNGVTGAASTIVQFWPKVMWASSSLTTMANGATFMGIVNRQSIITADFEADYSFNSTGYAWLAVPSMLNPGTLYFADVTNPINSGPYAMQQMGTLSINNGTSTYNYVMYRSTYNQLTASILRVAA